jgi:hypothetical protein
VVPVHAPEDYVSRFGNGVAAVHAIEWMPGDEPGLELNGEEWAMSRGLMKFAVCGLLVAAACASAVPAGAQYAGTSSSGKGALELTLFNGYYIGSDLYSSLGSGAQVALSNSYMWGGRLGTDMNQSFGMEFVYTRIGSDLSIKNAAAGFNPAGDLGRINGNAYDVDFNFYQPMGSPRARGYFSLGLGWTVTDPDIPAPAGKTVDGNSLFAWNFGVGTKVAMNDKLALRIEGRWRVTNTAITTSNGIYCDYWGYCYSYSSDWYNSGELTAGLTYKVGGRK